MDDHDFAPVKAEEKSGYISHDVGKKKRHLFFHHRGCWLGLALILVLAIFAVVVPLVSPYRFDEVHLSDKNLAPCRAHILGTDDLGRDLSTRTAAGLRISLFIGLLAAFLDMCIGLTWGAVSGFCGGAVDQIMMRTADFIYSVPYLLAVLLVAAFVGPGLSSILIAMCLVGWIQMARLVRTQTLATKSLDFVLAAHSLGVGPGKIVLRHIFPNIAGSTLAMLLLTIPHAIFTEAFLSFLGIGIGPPAASLGSMTADALPALRFYPWRLFIPALTVTATIFAFNLIGDALRDLLDPKQKKCIESPYAS
jgi:oligopeptide transport system permease protein